MDATIEKDLKLQRRAAELQSDLERKVSRALCADPTLSTPRAYVRSRDLETLTGLVNDLEDVYNID